MQKKPLLCWLIIPGMLLFSAFFLAYWLEIAFGLTTFYMQVFQITNNPYRFLANAQVAGFSLIVGACGIGFTQVVRRRQWYWCGILLVAAFLLFVSDPRLGSSGNGFFPDHNDPSYHLTFFSEVIHPLLALIVPLVILIYSLIPLPARVHQAK